MSNNSFYVMGLDVSTKTVGVTILDLTGKLKEIDYISFPKSSKKNGDVDIYDKVVYFRNKMNEYKQKYSVKHIYIEEPLKNGNNMNTTMILCKFNGMISQEVYNIFEVKPIHHSVHDLRKAFFPEYVKLKKEKGVIKEVLSLPTTMDKKKLVLEKVNNIAPFIKWVRDKNLLLKEENYDMADSFVVAMSGLLLSQYITKI